MRSALLGALAAAVACIAGPAHAVDVVIGMLRVEQQARAPLSRLDLPPDDDGFAGARVAIADNATTGRFLGHRYELAAATAAPEMAGSTLDDLLGLGARFILLDAGADATIAMAERAAQAGAVIMNVSAPDDRLRGRDCRANLFHVAASRRMLADGLTQYLVWKQWSDWLLVAGDHPADVAKAEAYRAAARKFGADIGQELVFEDTGGARRSDSGHVLTQRQIPVFMQQAGAHDVVVVADQSALFGAYLPYRTWAPRPVAGDAGLRASIWHPAHEGYGATQLQRRFERDANRRMTDIDFAAWAAVRAIGEAVTRTNAGDVGTLTAYLLGDAFELAAFKGLPLTFRPWSRQLRQAIFLGDGRNVVSISPQQEFLHQRNRLDTLGVDAPETECQL
jgi:ABC transporter substrate binding protein (PQQ-dependent alcohol dehydrogenase system)